MPQRLTTPRRGAITVLFAVMLVFLLAILALSIDTGVMYSTRNDLQRSVDSGALAAVRELILNPANAPAVGRQYTQANLVLAQSLQNSQITVDTGTWNAQNRVFTVDSTNQNAVRVQADLPNNAFLFGRAIGANSYNMSAQAIATFQPRDIMLVLDYSGSMTSENKIGDLKSAVNIFCSLVSSIGQGNDRVGYVRYSTTASLEQSLTTDINSVAQAASSGDADGWTDIGDGLMYGLAELRNYGRSNAKKIVVLLTDGMANRPEGLDPIQYVRNQAAIAAADNIPIYAISFGSDADQTLMAEVASIASGIHYHVASNYFNSYQNTDYGNYSGYSGYSSYYGTSNSSNESLEAVFRKIALNRGTQLVD